MKSVKKPIIIGAVHLPYYGRNNPFQSYSEIEEYVMQFLSQLLQISLIQTIVKAHLRFWMLWE